MIPSDPYGEIQMLLSGLPDTAATVVAKSKEFRDQDDIDFAFELLTMALERDPAPLLRAEMSDLLIEEGRWLEAADEALAALEVAPSHAPSQRSLRRALVAGLPQSTMRLAEVSHQFSDSDPDLAEALLMAGVEGIPDDLLLREQLAQFYGHHRRIVDCISALQAILRIDPEHDEAQLMLAGAFIKEGDYPRAQRLLNEARARGVQSTMLDKLELKISEVVKVITRAKQS